MTPAELEAYLFEHIPISAAMGVHVVAVEPAIRLSAAMAPNVNHRGTVFGGSLASVATLAAWSALRVRLGDSARLVIASQTTEYLRPVEGDFVAVAAPPEGEALESFLAAYRRRGKARIVVEAQVEYGNAVAVTLKGTFAALADRP